MEEHYDSFWKIAMMYCEGNIKDAEYMLDCGVYMFYYRMKHKAIYNTEIEKQAKEK